MDVDAAPQPNLQPAALARQPSEPQQPSTMASCPTNAQLAATDTLADSVARLAAGAGEMQRLLQVRSRRQAAHSKGEKAARALCTGHAWRRIVMKHRQAKPV